MPPQEKEQFVRHYVEEVMNKGNMSVYEELVDPNVIEHGPDFRSLGLPGDTHGRLGTREGFQALRNAVPDLRYDISNVRETDDETVEFDWTATGTHSASRLMGRAATGKSGSVSGTTTFRIVNGKIVESTAQWDPIRLKQHLEL